MRILGVKFAPLRLSVGEHSSFVAAKAVSRSLVSTTTHLSTSLPSAPQLARRKQMRKLQDLLQPAITGLWQFCPPSLNACVPPSPDSGIVAPTAVDCAAAIAPEFSQLSLNLDPSSSTILGNLVYNLDGNSANFQSSAVIGSVIDALDISLVTPGIPGVWGGNITAAIDPSQSFFTFPVTLPSNDTFQACWLRIVAN